MQFSSSRTETPHTHTECITIEFRRVASSAYTNTTKKTIKGVLQYSKHHNSWQYTNHTKYDLDRPEGDKSRYKQPCFTS